MLPSLGSANPQGLFPGFSSDGPQAWVSTLKMIGSTILVDGQIQVPIHPFRPALRLSASPGLDSTETMATASRVLLEATLRDLDHASHMSTPISGSLYARGTPPLGSTVAG